MTGIDGWVTLCDLEGGGGFHSMFRRLSVHNNVSISLPSAQAFVTEPGPRPDGCNCVTRRKTSCGERVVL